MPENLRQHNSNMDHAEALNHGCICRTLDAQQLHQQLDSDPALTGLAKTIAQTRPNLFSSTAVFISASTRDTIVASVAAIERVMALPAYQARALARARHCAATFRPGRGLHGLRLSCQCGRTTADRDQHQCRRRAAQCGAGAGPNRVLCTA